MTKLNEIINKNFEDLTDEEIDELLLKLMMYRNNRQKIEKKDRWEKSGIFIPDKDKE